MYSSQQLYEVDILPILQFKETLGNLLKALQLKVIDLEFYQSHG